MGPVPLRFGLGLPTGFPVGEPNLDFARFAERAEELGYDALWVGDHVVFHIARYEVFTTLAARAPHPPIWIGGRADAALRRTVAYGDAWFPGWVTPERYREGWRKIEALCADRGRDPREIEKALYLFVCVDRDRERARRAAEEFLSRNYAMPFAPFARYVVTGRPEDCADAVRGYLEAGARHVTFRFASARPLPQLELWTAEVLPALRAGEETAPRTS